MCACQHILLSIDCCDYHDSMDFLKCIRKKIEQDIELKENLYSLIMFGSYVRGDFVDGVSDLDFFAVLREGREEIIPRLKVVLEECTSGVKRLLVDLPWEYLENLDDPLNKGYPFKFLTFYQDDFLENHVVVYGSGIEDILPRYDWRTLVRWRAERLLNAAVRFKGDPKMLQLSAGEVARFMALLNGARSIKKSDILGALEEIDDEEALEIYTAYLNGRELEVEEEFWVNFIISRIKKFLNGK